MMISKTMNQRLNEQVSREFAASQTYLAMACTFDGLGLSALAARFREQSAEEREHALKLIGYVSEVGGVVTLEALDAPRSDYPSVSAAIEAALDSEKSITRQIHDLVDLAETEKDHATRSFLQWFVDEQVEEVASMSQWLLVANMAGKNLLQLDSYVRHIAKQA